MSDATYTIDEFGDLFGLTRAERVATSAALNAARKQPRRIADLLSPAEQAELSADLAEMANLRRRAAAESANWVLP